MPTGATQSESGRCSSDSRAYEPSCNTRCTIWRQPARRRSRRFNGFKRHVAADLDTDLILACAITPANRPEEEAVPNLRQDLARQPRSEIGELSIDRGYVGSNLVTEFVAEGREVLCKPWVARNAFHQT